jgi:hypothetical protein
VSLISFALIVLAIILLAVQHSRFARRIAALEKETRDHCDELGALQAQVTFFKLVFARVAIAAQAQPQADRSSLS